MMYTVDKSRSHFNKFLRGWRDGGGWLGYVTVNAMWEWATEQHEKPTGCSWYAYGLIIARAEDEGRRLQALSEEE